VVENASGDRLPSLTVSGVTVCDHRIYGVLGKRKRSEAACRGRGG